MAVSLLSRRGGKEVNKVLMLPVAEIVSNRNQPRKFFDQQALQELSYSIVTNGLLQPVTVRELSEGGYELIAGERRLLAFRSLGREHIPAIIEDCNDAQSAVLAMIENLQRRDLNCFEEADGIARLMQGMGLTQHQVSQKLGKAQSTIANKLRLLRFSPQMQEKIVNGRLTERHARALLSLPDIEDIGAVDYVINNNLTVEQTEDYVKSLLLQRKTRATRLVLIRDMRIFLNSINKAVKMMHQAGIDVDMDKKETDDIIELTMRVPKTSVYNRSGKSFRSG